MGIPIGFHLPQDVDVGDEPRVEKQAIAQITGADARGEAARGGQLRWN